MRGRSGASLSSEPRVASLPWKSVGPIVPRRIEPFGARAPAPVTALAQLGPGRVPALDRHLDERLRKDLEVRMRVVDARNHGPATQLDASRRRSGERLESVARCPRRRCVRPGWRALRRGDVRVAGEDLPLEQDQIRRTRRARATGNEGNRKPDDDASCCRQHVPSRAITGGIACVLPHHRRVAGHHTLPERFVAQLVTSGEAFSAFLVGCEWPRRCYPAFRDDRLLGKLKDHPAYRAWLAGLECEWLEYRRDFGSPPESA